MRVAKYAKQGRESAKGDVVVKVRLGRAVRVCQRQTPTAEPVSIVYEVRMIRVNICQNIWSLLRDAGANFAGESDC